MINYPARGFAFLTCLATARYTMVGRIIWHNHPPRAALVSSAGPITFDAKSTIFHIHFCNISTGDMLEFGVGDVHLPWDEVKLLDRS
ncbi:hypothetical protein F5Y10DRAFT_253337 [Nemania abortiva]|nr:hypothetical protein F5Y10DRAFT_253337 [Nemania abortiva]